MSDPTVKRSFVYFTNRHELRVLSTGNGMWDWQYLNSQGKWLKEGSVHADTVIAALDAAAEDAGVAEHLYG